MVYFPAITMVPTASSKAEGHLYEIYAQPYGFGEDPTDQIPDQGEQDDKVPDLALQSEDPRARQIEENRRNIHKGWDPVAAQLRRTGLFENGSESANKVRKLGLKIPPLALYQRFWKRHAYIDNLRLHLTGAKAPEGNSAELAMALALLLAATWKPYPLVIATGRLGEQPSGTSDKEPDVEVLSVGKLPEKLRLVERLARDKELPRGREHTDPVWLFTPATLDDDGMQIAVEALPEVARLKALGVTVIPVKTLGEAAGYLKAKRARWMWQDWAWLGGIAGMVGLALMLNATIERLTPPPPPPKLTVRVQDQENKWPPLEKVFYVGPYQALKLEFTQNPGEFHYVLTLDSDGDAHFHHEFDPKKSEDTITIPAIKTESRGVFILLMLVSDQIWSRNQGEKLAEKIADLGLKPELPDGVRYRFDSEHCGPVNAPVPDGFTSRGGPAQCTTCDQLPLPTVCDDWALQLLNTLRQLAPGKIRLDGIAFQVSRD